MTTPQPSAVGRVRMARNVCWMCTAGRHDLCTGCDCCERTSVVGRAARWVSRRAQRTSWTLVAASVGTVAAAVIAVVLLVVPFADWAVDRGVTLQLLVAGLLPLGLLVSHLMPRPVRASPWRPRTVPTGRLRGAARRRVRPLLAFAGRAAGAPTP